MTREETCCCHMGYSFQFLARDLSYAPPHRQDTTYHVLCYTIRGALFCILGGVKHLLIPSFNNLEHNFNCCLLTVLAPISRQPEGSCEKLLSASWPGKHVVWRKSYKLEVVSG